MKYAIVLATVAAFAVSPAMAGGRGGSLLGGIVAPVTTAVSGVKINALNNVSVLSGNGIANGNKVGIVAPVKAIVSKNGIVGGLLGGWILTAFGVGGGGWIFSMLTAIGGAVLLLWIVGMVTGRRSA